MSLENEARSIDLDGSLEGSIKSGPSLSSHHQERHVSLAPSHEVLYPQVNNNEDRSSDNRMSYSNSGTKDQIFGVLLNQRKGSEFREPLVPNRRSGWKNLSSLEKALSVSLGIVSTLAVALMIAVIVVGIKLNEDDYEPKTKPPSSTQYPPWITTIPPPSEVPEVTTKERPTSQPPTTTSMYVYETCSSPECLRAGGEIEMKMNKSADPCDDFYQFACGGWVRANPTSESKQSMNQFDKIQERLNFKIKSIVEASPLETDGKAISMAKQFYKTCMSGDGQDDLDAVRNLIEEVLSNSTFETGSSLGTVLAKIRKELGGNYIFHLEIDTDLEDIDKTSAFLDNLDFGVASAYLDKNSSNDHLIAYKEMLMEFWAKVYPTSNATDLEIVADDIIQFERDLSDICTNTPLVKVFNESTSAIPDISISEEETWRFFVDEVLEDILNNCGDSGCETFSSPNIVLRDFQFFEQIETLLNKTESSIIGDYLKWRIIMDYGKESSKAFRTILSSASKILDIKDTSERWESCVEKANHFFGSEIANVYVKENIKDPISFNNMLNEMVQTLKTSFSEILQDASWLTLETQGLVLERLDALQILLGYPILFENENVTQILERNNTLKFTNSSSHFQNILDLTKWKCENELRTVLITSEELVALRNAEKQTTVESSYSSLSNVIYFPFGLLDAPVYRNLGNNTLAPNYGSMGMLIGRLLVEAFEDTAATYMNGSVIGMWDSETLDGFENATNCIKEQYSRYNVSELHNSRTINGKNTVQANTADLGGLKIALKAYESEREPFQDQKLAGLVYTPDQLFYLSLAQTWCSAQTPERLLTEVLTGSQTPAPYRVKGVLENTEEFLETWKCPIEEDEGLCRIW